MYKETNQYNSRNYNERVEERKVNCCKHLFYNACFLILLILMILLFYGFLSDVNLKYEQEMETERARINECMKDYYANNCATPIPYVVEYCKEKTLCMNLDPKL